MDEREFNRQIEQAWAVLYRPLGIARTIVSARSLRTDEVFRDVALDENASYQEIFTTGLSRSHYNILLNDYAFYQFGWESERSWRLGYFPNPWLSGVPSAKNEQHQLESLEEAGLLTHEEVSDLLSEMSYRGAVPPIRFEYACDQYREIAHPAAHFHIGRHTDNRWASALAIGPLAFSLHISKMYYPEAWRAQSNFSGAAVAECIDRRLSDVLNNVRLVHEFSAIDRAALHFGRYIAAQD
jgi:hypothetical protein